ncbi:hypothetical protein [Sphaerisporangium fuscum]|uniref:hypothetical protein n=1 Tax=Sphaerisporangium fuscum TaxID=2835868 RepID=UPI001BDD80A7|nr:hypothetical protein [Sphaerisporangium fuscum]
MHRSLKTVFLAAALSLGGVVANPAHAIAASYSPEGVCGSGFSVVKHDGKRAVKTPSGTVFGYIYLLYNARTGQNCVTTIKTQYVGTKTITSAQLEVQGGGKKSDIRSYKYYAGPVKLYGKGKCVKYYGTVADTRAQGEIAQGGRSSWGNCGKG